MKSWFDIADGRLRFRGFTKQPIAEWIASGEGAEAVQAAARRTRFSLIGRTRAARRRMCRDLWEAIGAGAAVRETVAAECDRYLAAWTQLAYAPSLPRLTVAFQRLVVVPRAMILARTASGASARVAASLATAGVDDPFKAFFGRWIIDHMDEAIRRAGPCPQRPIHARESWACVALDRDFIWIDPRSSGRDWRGHVVMFEMPAPRLQRRDRRKLEASIEQLTQSLPELARPQRDSIVRIATDQMSTLRF